MSRILLLICCVLLPSHRCLADVVVQAPTNESLFLVNPIAIQGKATGAQVTVEVAQGAAKKQTYQVKVVNGTWQVPQAALNNGWNVITVTDGGKPKHVLVTRGTGINPGGRGKQKVRFEWEPGVERKFVLIGQNTLGRRLTPKEEAAFVTAVKARTIEVFFRAYQQFGLVLVDKDGKDVHTLKISKQLGGDRVGQTECDCGNLMTQQASDIFVGTYYYNMTLFFNDPNPLINWRPMDRKDPWFLRAEDLGEMLGRTAAHEMGHGLGLVGCPKACGWMNGCEQNHGCPGFQNFLEKQYPLLEVKRYGRGRLLMDPGDKTPNWARMAASKATERGLRQPSEFGAFDRSYLEFIIPK